MDVVRDLGGAKPVFTPEIEEDISKCLYVWLQATNVGVAVDYIIAYL